ncbi:hypothetical protein HZA40_02680, partial [Candidatus Peregrinibacteria bacterium]|nr:hypothetical protein [Candidatus Peregrinibacteria bacterium]
KLDESVNVVSHNVLGLDRLNVDLIVNESLKTEVKTPNSSGTVPEVSRTPEQKVVAVNLDKLSQGQKLNVYEQKQVEDAVQKQVEKSMTEQLQQALVQPVVPTPGEISGGGSGGGGATIVPRAPVSIPITLANGRKIELKKVPKFKVTLDTKKAVDLQNIADANSEDVVVVTPSTVINDNNVSALLSVQNGGQIGDPLADEKIFFAGVAGLASKATKIEDLKPDVPKITNLVPGMRLAPKFMIGLAGPEAAEKLSVFAVDKGVSKDPNSWKVYKLEKYQLDEKFKNAVEVDLSGKMDAEVKNFTLVVQDENGKGSATDVILNKNIEMKLNDLTLQNEDQITVRGYAEPGSLVFVNWKSVLKTSTVIADASQGYFEVQVPKGLEKGDHTAYTYSYNPSKRMASSFAKVLFSKFF